MQSLLLELSSLFPSHFGFSFCSGAVVVVGEQRVCNAPTHSRMQYARARPHALCVCVSLSSFCHRGCLLLTCHLAFVEPQPRLTQMPYVEKGTKRWRCTYPRAGDGYRRWRRGGTDALSSLCVCVSLPDFPPAYICPADLLSALYVTAWLCACMGTCTHTHTHARTCR